MTTRFSVFIATSLDGFIARKDGSIDWLLEANKLVPAGEDCGYADFMATVDCMVMGRGTYDSVLGFDQWPYGETRVIVLTTRPLERPAHVPATVETSSESPDELARRLASEGVSNVYLDGGATIQAFLKAGLVDSMVITTIPVLIGEGRPLFGPLEADIHLLHDTTRSWDFGFVQSRWLVGPPSAKWT